MRIAGKGKEGAEVGGNVAVGDGVTLGVDVGVIVAVRGKGVVLGSAVLVRATAVGTYPSGKGVEARVLGKLQLVKKNKIKIKLKNLTGLKDLSGLLGL